MHDDDILRQLAALPTDPPSVLCVGAPRETVLAWQPSGAAPAVLRLAVGMQQLVDEALRRLPPDPAQLEHAIDLAEEALMRPSLAPPAGALLHVAGLFAPVLPHLAGHGRTELEALFQRLAAWSLGNPAAVAGLPQDRTFVAATLLLRELMHHLGLETLAD
ncbi:MAG TPA: hypothetical protein VMS38_19815 [Pseudorhodoferax sp.]|nr:hypothetical protein [Pseudorhodoferax sp.]